MERGPEGKRPSSNISLKLLKIWISSWLAALSRRPTAPIRYSLAPRTQFTSPVVMNTIAPRGAPVAAK